MLELEGPVWKFALEFYRRPGISDACLTLQDECDVDVVQLIVVLFASRILGRNLSAAELSEMRERSSDWREMTVLPLRRIRRALKPLRPEFPQDEKEHFRARIKTAELLAEQIQLAMVNQWLKNTAPASDGLSLEDALEMFLKISGGRDCPPSCRLALTRIITTVMKMDDI
jgi:uncharacterized protein (TIGR02444 family)